MGDLKIFAKNIEEEALKQIETFANHPAFSDCKIRIMPDAHAGKGCVIGFTSTIKDKVVPNVVGVDIGCGMMCIRIPGYGKPIDYAKLDDVIHEYIPSGMNVNEEPGFDVTKFGLFCVDELRNKDWIERSLGTLGSGNHFIEVDEGKYGEKYLIIHTGSRNLGKQVCEIYQNMAIKNLHDGSYARESEKLIASYKAQHREREISGALKDLKKKLVAEQVPDDLCYLTDEDAANYFHDMKLCQCFAVINREVIAERIFERMGWFYSHETAFHTVHNYIDDCKVYPDGTEEMIVRKGAVCADKWKPLLIPLNMKDGCIMGVGKGNPDWNRSAPHGAGRAMSRGQARRNLNLDDYRAQMDGIYSTSVCTETLDESPMAYKPMDDILERIGETVEIKQILKPVYNFKAKD